MTQTDLLMGLEAASGACACGRAKHEVLPAGQRSEARLRAAWTSSTIAVVRDRRSTRVDVDRLVARTFAGVAAIRLLDLWTATPFSSRLAGVTFDFVGEDGFRPSKRPIEHRRAITAAHLLQGYLSLASRTLLWDPTLDLPCFYRVKGVIAVVALEI